MFTGYLVDSVDDRDWAFDEIPYGAQRRVIPTPDHMVYIPTLEQVGNSCVGVSVAAAWHACHELAGVSLPTKSWPQVYAQALAFENRLHTSQGARFPDRGCYPRLALQAARNIGVANYVDCPVQDLLDTKQRTVGRPTPNHIRSGIDERGRLSFRRIHGQTASLSVASGACDLAARSMMLGMPVIFGMLIDTAFCDYDGNGAISSIDMRDIVGGHMMAVLKVDDEKVRFANWWGGGWGAFGHGWMTRRVFESRAVRDIYSIEVKQ